jgi:hypothetical protein
VINFAQQQKIEVLVEHFPLQRAGEADQFRARRHDPRTRGHHPQPVSTVINTIGARNPDNLLGAEDTRRAAFRHVATATDRKIPIRGCPPARRCDTGPLHAAYVYAAINADIEWN